MCIEEDVRSYVEACHARKGGKASSQKPGDLLKSLPFLNAPRLEISIDFMLRLA